MCHNDFEIEFMVSMKKCSICLKDKEDGDFYHENMCFHCQYLEKLKSQKKYKKVCKVCEGTLGKGKSAYCSDKCHYIAKTMYNHSYWLRKCTAPKISWKN